MTNGPTSPATKRTTVALIGNPNTGKSSIFNALCGMKARVGNFPGVTVEKKIGRFQHEHVEYNVIDLPGTYSLSARSADEMVSVDVLLGNSKEVDSIATIIVVLDASNLERNLYLFSQLQELGIPIVAVLNMWDRVESANIQIDTEQLAARLNVPVVVTVASKKRGIDELKQKIALQSAHAIHQSNTETNSDSPQSPSSKSSSTLFPEAITSRATQLQTWLASKKISMPDYAVERLIMDIGSPIETRLGRQINPDELAAQLTRIRTELNELGFKVPTAETKIRYDWIRKTIDGVITRPDTHQTTFSDRVDHILTHRWWGFGSFVLIMFLLFQLVFIELDYFSPTAWIEASVGWLGETVQSWLAPGALRSLLVDGVIGGVGSVIVFLPQIATLFFLIAIMEDCGYMARVAMVMDKLMTRVGLNGKAFLPLMTSFGCAVPGIMATRTIENRKDRMITILVAPLMSCSARLQVYTLMIGTFFPMITFLGGWVNLHGLLFLSMYSLGALVAIPVAWLLRKTAFRGPQSPFVLELPEYKWPSPAVVLQRVWEQVTAFLLRAGTLIFCTAILVWAAAYFPSDHSREFELTANLEQLEAKIEQDDQTPEDRTDDDELNQLVAQVEALEQEINVERSRLIEASFLGMAGKQLEPVFHSIGWDWKIGVGVIASFPAREVIIATLGTIYSLGGDISADSNLLRDQLQAATWPDGSPVFTWVTALTIMVFFALCSQCAATLMVIQRETQSWWWPLFTFLYMTLLAYFAAWLIYTLAG